MKNCDRVDELTPVSGGCLLFVEQLEEALEERQLSDRRDPNNPMQYCVKVDRRKGPRRKDEIYRMMQQHSRAS